MGKYCIGCGKEINSEMDYCESCEAKIKSADSTKAQDNARTVYSQADYQNMNRNASYNHIKDKANTAPSMWVYFGLMFLFSIPVVGWIAAIIMAFAADNDSIKNYSRANVIYSIIMSVISFIIAVILISGIASINRFNIEERYFDEPIHEYREGIFEGYEDKGI